MPAKNPKKYINQRLTKEANKIVMGYKKRKRLPNISEAIIHAVKRAENPDFHY
jgi:hypothetical protein